MSGDNGLGSGIDAGIDEWVLGGGTRSGRSSGEKMGKYDDEVDSGVNAGRGGSSDTGVSEDIDVLSMGGDAEARWKWSNMRASITSSFLTMS